MRRPLTIPMRDAWLLTAAAVDADLIDRARELADYAMSLCPWERFRCCGSVAQVELRSCGLLPRGWAYYGRRGRWDELLLMHPDVVPFVTQVADFQVLRRAAQGVGGLQRMDVMLSVVLSAELVAEGLDELLRFDGPQAPELNELFDF